MQILRTRGRHLRFRFTPLAGQLLLRGRRAGSPGGCEAGSLHRAGKGMQEPHSGFSLGSKIRKTGVTSPC